MICNGKALQQQSESADSEYRQAESHSNKNEEVHPKDNAMVTQQFLCKYKNKEVKVTVELPEQSNPQDEQEFTDILKNIYLEKVKIGAMQKKESALPSPTTKDMEE